MAVNMPIGTEVVLKDGSVGVIAFAPVDNGTNLYYDVRIANGSLVTFNQNDLTVRKRISADTIQNKVGVALTKDNLYQHGTLLLDVTVGSKAFGLANEDSDDDRRVVFVGNSRYVNSIADFPDTIDEQGVSFTAWEVRHFIRMALRANPNILEALNSPLVHMRSYWGKILQENSYRFLSKMVYQTYIGYVNSQFKKLEADLRNKGEIKNKHAMHLIRLLISGTVLLNEQRVLVDVGEYRYELLAIKHGELPWDAVLSIKDQYLKRIEWAYENTKLPDFPDYSWADRTCIGVRESVGGIF